MYPTVHTYIMCLSTSVTYQVCLPVPVRRGKFVDIYIYMCDDDAPHPKQLRQMQQRYLMSMSCIFYLVLYIARVHASCLYHDHVENSMYITSTKYFVSVAVLSLNF
jgi:hypothetical protein